MKHEIKIASLRRRLLKQHHEISLSLYVVENVYNNNLFFFFFFFVWSCLFLRLVQICSVFYFIFHSSQPAWVCVFVGVRFPCRTCPMMIWFVSKSVQVGPHPSRQPKRIEFLPALIGATMARPRTPSTASASVAAHLMIVNTHTHTHTGAVGLVDGVNLPKSRNACRVERCYSTRLCLIGFRSR